MLNYIVVSVVAGLVFGSLDGLINGNRFARKLMSVYDPVARTSINVPVGLLIDLIYGFVMAGIFLLLYSSLPGASGWVKGLSYGLIMWFFRVVMFTATIGMIVQMPARALIYMLITGLAEMLIIGLIFGLCLTV